MLLTNKWFERQLSLLVSAAGMSFKGSIMPPLKVLMLLGFAAFIAACTTPPGGGSGSPSTPGSPLPTPPSGGGAPSPPGQQPPTPPSPSPSSGDSGDSDPSFETPDGKPADASESKEGAEGEQGAESADGGEADSPPPEWEDDETADEPEEPNEDGVTFEDPPKGGAEQADPNFEEPDFESQGGLTEQELEELEKELDETLGDFDEEIEREQTYAEERANENASEETLGNVGTFEDYSEEDDGNAKGKGRSQSSAASSSDSSQSGEGGEGGAGGAGGEGGTKRQGNNPAQDVADDQERVKDEPDVVDNRANDDIVARQIREAAEQETDPELKKKLWEEYRNYKRQ